MNDPYQVLGVPETATDEEIKRLTGSWHANTIRITIMITPWQIWRRKR